MQEGARADQDPSPTPKQPTAATTRIVFHVDMDAFYAGVETRERPELKHVPLVIGADPRGGQGRGVVCTANYPARKYGIRSAMPISTAYRLAPHAVFLPPDFSKYGPASEAVMQVLERYADVLEVVGMDEAYLDVTARCGGDWRFARSLALSLQAAVKRETGLSCSVGIAPNKSVAKVASDRRKPHGVTVVPPSQVAQFLDPLATRCLNGCGPKTAALLEEEGIRTVGDLARADPKTLDALLGSHGHWLWRIAHGDDPRPVEAERGARKSRGNETTFGRDQEHPDKVLLAAADLLEELIDSHDRRDRRSFTTVTVKLRYSDFTTLTRARTEEVPFEMDRADTPGRSWAVAKNLLQPLLDGRPIRLVGVRLSGFIAAQGQRALSSYGVGLPPVRLRHRAAAAEKPWGAFDPGGLRQVVLA